jgi:serine/threonine protein kinase
VGRQIGSGSFSVVWHARHRVHGTEVAIKEIATGRLNKKLQESLMSEIHILKRINHPNIIRLHDIIQVCEIYFCRFFFFFFSFLNNFLFGCGESGGKSKENIFEVSYSLNFMTH